MAACACPSRAKPAAWVFWSDDSHACAATSSCNNSIVIITSITSGVIVSTLTNYCYYWSCVAQAAAFSRSPLASSASTTRRKVSPFATFACAAFASSSAFVQIDMCTYDRNNNIMQYMLNILTLFNIV